MLELHPECIEKDGKKFVVLPFEEFQEVLRLLRELDELRDQKPSWKRPIQKVVMPEGVSASQWVIEEREES